MKLFLLFLSFYIVSLDLESNETNTDECISKKLQIMMPEYPYTTYQGYALVNFDVNEEGNLKNIYLNLNSKMDVRFSVPNAVDTSNLSLNKEVDLTFSSSKAVVLPSGPLAVD